MASGVRPSLALGGFSTVWGAAMLPYRDADIDNWPVQNAELAQHYRAVAEFTGLAAQRDDLEEFFPLHCERSAPASTQPAGRPAARQSQPPSRPASRTRLAVWPRRGWPCAPPIHRKAPAASIAACACMAVPTAAFTIHADTVRELRAGKGFTYQRDVIVTSLRENSGKVIIEGYHRQTRAPLEFEADRAYLAAGVIPTAQILLRSQDAYDQPLHLRDSQYYLFPLLLAPARSRRANRIALHVEPVVHRD